MSKRKTFILGLIITTFAVFVFGGNFSSPLGYDHMEFDYATGQIRIRHRTFGIWHSTTHKDFWLDAYTPSTDAHDWHFVGYTSRFAPKVNSNAGRIQSRIRTIDQQLQMTNADEQTRQRVADFIFEQLILNESDGDDSVNAVSIFDCINENWPTERYHNEPIPLQVVLNLIEDCTNPAEPSTNSP